MSMDTMTYYEILEVSTSASIDEITRAYRKMARKYHPDLNGKETESKFATVNAAYETLSDDASRLEYDEGIGVKNDGSSQDSVEEEERRQERRAAYFEKSDVDPHEYYRDGIQEIPVRWSHLGWYKQAAEKDIEGDLKGTEKVVKLYPYRWQFYAVSMATLVLMLVMLPFIWITPTAEGLGHLLFKLLLILGLFGVMYYSSIARSGDYPKKVHIWGHVLYGLYLAVTLGWMIVNGSPVVIAGFLVGFVSLAGRVFSDYYRYKRIMNAGISVSATEYRKLKKNILKFYQWGKAGNLDDAVRKFGPHHAHAGIIGERYTDELIQTFSVFPGVRVMHGLDAPDDYNTDVNHVVISGENVIFVDSKQWGPGTYSWAGDGNIRRQNGNQVEYVSVNFADAVDRYRMVLPERAKVYGIMLVHGYGIEIAGDSVHDGVSLATTENGIDQIGLTISDGNPDGTIDYFLWDALVSHIK